MSAQSEQFQGVWAEAERNLALMPPDDRSHLLAKYEEEARKKGLLSELREIRKLKEHFSTKTPPTG